MTKLIGLFLLMLSLSSNATTLDEVTLPDIVKVEDLEKYSNPLLNITEDDKEDEFKYVLQTRKLANTKNTLIKVPMGVFARNEAFIDSDMSLVMQRLREYYV